MKIRSGFVSNSSSTSFVIYGKEIEDVDSFLNEISDMQNVGATLAVALDGSMFTVSGRGKPCSYDVISRWRQYLPEKKNIQIVKNLNLQ